MEDIIIVLIKVGAGLLAVLIGYLGLQLQKWLKAKLKVADNEWLTAFVGELCKAAEQLYGSGKGEDKFDYVIRLLEATGVVITDYIRAKIEANVLEINQANKEATAVKIGGSE